MTVSAALTPVSTRVAAAPSLLPAGSALILPRAPAAKPPPRPAGAGRDDTAGSPPLDAEQQQVADSICFTLGHLSNSDSLRRIAEQVVGELRQFISPETLMQTAAWLIQHRISQLAEAVPAVTVASARPRSPQPATAPPAHPDAERNRHVPRRHRHPPQM